MVLPWLIVGASAAFEMRRRNEPDRKLKEREKKQALRRLQSVEKELKIQKSAFDEKFTVRCFFDREWKWPSDLFRTANNCSLERTAHFSALSYYPSWQYLHLSHFHTSFFHSCWGFVASKRAVPRQSAARSLLRQPGLAGLPTRSKKTPFPLNGWTSQV
jgi:hypothetical protein